MTGVSDHLKLCLERELDEGEEIVWSAQPAVDLVRRETRPLATGALVALLLLSALITPISVVDFFHVREAVLEHGGKTTLYYPPLLFGIGGVAIIAFGVWAYGAIMKQAVREAQETAYAITPRRAIVLRVKKDGTSLERDYRADELIHLARDERKDGRGTITFESARGAARTNSTASSHKFRAIDDVIEVERMLRRLFGDA